MQRQKHEYQFGTSEEALQHVLAFSDHTQNVAGITRNNHGYIEGLQLKKNRIEITNPIVNSHWEKYTLSLTQSSLQPVTLTNPIQTMSQSTNQTYSHLSNSVTNSSNLVMPIVYTYPTEEEASLRVAAFSEIDSKFPRYKKGYLTGLQLKGNQVHLLNTNLNDVWNQHQIQFNSMFQQSVQPPAYSQTVSQVPSTLFSSQLNQSTQLSSPVIYICSTQEEALNWVKAFSEVTTGFPRDHYHYLKNLKLNGKEIHIYDENLNSAWLGFANQQNQTQILSPVYKPQGM